jgi:PAS domain S-box-containing protein
VLETNRDITDRKRAEAALRESEARLRLALEAAELGIWEVDLAAGTVRWDRRCRAIYGLDGEAPLALVEAMALIHDDDRRAVHAAYEQAIAPGSSGSYATEKRIVWRDGSVRWVVSKGRVYFTGRSTGRRAVRMLGTAMDVTDRKQAEQTLHQAKEGTRPRRAPGQGGGRACQCRQVALSRRRQPRPAPAAAGARSAACGPGTQNRRSRDAADRP